MLGAISLTGPAFDVVEMEKLGTFEQMQAKLDPKPMGFFVVLEHLKIHVDAVEQLYEGQKVYQIRTHCEKVPQS